MVGEIWVHGDNVADGYWRRPPEEQRCFNATLVDPSAGTPDGPWLRTGDLGFVSGSELFIVGRIKDLVIIRGRNHYPEDIEATVQEITRGRVAAISVPLNSTEQLVTVVEIKKHRRLRRGREGPAQRAQKRCHIGDLEFARAECRRPRPGGARIDPHHDERQGPPRRLRRFVPPGSVRQIGRLSGPALAAHFPMILTVLLMALAVSFEPFRVGMTVLMLSRPKPALQLMAFLLGGFAMGTTVGLIVLFIFRRILLGSILHVAAGADSDRALVPDGRGDRRRRRASPTRRAARHIHDTGSTPDARRFAVGRGNSRTQHRFTVGRLPRRVGCHPGLRCDRR